MHLPEAEIKLFYKLYHPLLLYTAQKTGQAKDVSLSGEIKQIPFQQLNDVRVALYGSGDLIDSFIAENPLGFLPEELAIVSGWKKFIKGKFVVMRYLKDKNLLILYHQEMGKIHATSYKKSWRDIGLKNAWFGILQGIIVAGGATKQEVERVVQEIVPVDKHELVYIFQFKTK